MSFLEGQKFSIVQPTGVKIVAFVINQTPAEEWEDYPFYLLEKLDYVERENDGKVTKTFSVQTSDEVLNVIVLSLAKNRCVIGHGKIKDDQFVAENETIQLQYTNVADVVSEEQEFSFKYNSKRQIVLIDVDDGEQVIPKITKDEVAKSFIGKYKLMPYKNYIALELAVKLNKSISNIQNNKTSDTKDDKKIKMEELAKMKI